MAEARKPALLLGLVVSLLLHLGLLACAWLWFEKTSPVSAPVALQAVLRPADQPPAPDEPASIDVEPAPVVVENPPVLPAAITPASGSADASFDAVAVQPKTPPEPAVEVARPDRALDLSLPGGQADSTHPLFLDQGKQLARIDLSQPGSPLIQRQQALPSRSDVPLVFQETRFASNWRDLDRRTPYQAVSEDVPLLGFALGLFKSGPISNPNCPMYLRPEDCLSPFPTTR